MTDVILIAHNLRSAHNIGSLLRTAEGLGVGKVYITGYSPYPQRENDERLPHLARKIDQQITKTALGAEHLIQWSHRKDIKRLIHELQNKKYKIAALEQAPDSLNLAEFVPPRRLALILGREVEGIEPEILESCDYILEIPMLGSKESFNVVQAAAMALFQLKFPR
jgi:23S rRNA (guanosine2251-2'-O)-methyltransferase